MLHFNILLKRCKINNIIVYIKILSIIIIAEHILLLICHRFCFKVYAEGNLQLDFVKSTMAF